MRRVALIVLLSIAVTASVAVAVAGDKDKAAFKPGPASSYPNAQTLDKITIAAVPYTTRGGSCLGLRKGRSVSTMAFCRCWWCWRTTRARH